MSHNGPLPQVVAAGGSGASSFTAYSLVCGGTTSTGALQNVSGVGTAGQVLVSAGAGSIPAWGDSGRLVLLSTANASAVASVTFDNTIITSSFTNYMVVFENITTPGGSTFSMTVSANNGSSYAAAGYISGLWYLSYNSATVNNANQTTFYELFTGASTTATSGTLFLYNMGSANSNTIQGDFVVSGLYWQKCVGQQTTASINNIKFSIDASTFSGKVRIYGVR